VLQQTPTPSHRSSRNDLTAHYDEKNKPFQNHTFLFVRGTFSAMIRQVMWCKEMNRSGNILFCLCTAILLAANMGRAQTVFWSDGFETNTPSRWAATAPWHIGSPTAGPAKNSSGYRTHSGVNCASTQNYSYNQDGRIPMPAYLPL
jgi:hypothetical protein